CFCHLPPRKNLGRLRSHPVGDRCRPFSLWSERSEAAPRLAFQGWPCPAPPAKLLLLGSLLGGLLGLLRGLLRHGHGSLSGERPVLHKRHNSGRIFEKCRVQSFVLAKDFRKSSYSPLASSPPWILSSFTCIAACSVSMSSLNQVKGAFVKWKNESRSKDFFDQRASR